MIDRGRITDQELSKDNSVRPIISDIFIDWWCRSKIITNLNLTINRPHYRESAVAYSHEFLPVLASLVLNHASLWSITDLWQMWSDLTHSEFLNKSVQDLYGKIGVQGIENHKNPFICQFARHETLADTDILPINKLLPPILRYVMVSPGVYHILCYHHRSNI